LKSKHAISEFRGNHGACLHFVATVYNELGFGRFYTAGEFQIDFLC